jgi:hypothetical protein
MEYKEFNINCKYSQQVETNFKITEEYFKKKVTNHNHQDTNVNRHMRT